MNPFFYAYLTFYTCKPEYKNLYWPAGSKLCHTVISLLFWFCGYWFVYLIYFEKESHRVQLTLHLLGSQG